MVAIRRKVGAYPVEAFNIITNTVAASSLRGAGFQPIPEGQGLSRIAVTAASSRLASRDRLRPISFDTATNSYWKHSYWKQAHEGP